MRVIALALVVLLLSACKPTQVAMPPASTYCRIARPITWVSEDSRVTKEQIDAHNRTWKRLCKQR
jgi:hypothetical protein